MERPVPTPGEKSHRSSIRLWLVGFLGATSIALAGLCVFLLTEPQPPSGKVDPRFLPVDAITLATLPVATRFDMPMGSESGALTYNAQPFTENRHLGDDLNGIGGENTDLGDPVYAIANGRIIYTGNPAPGWGNMILMMIAYEENGRRKYVQACYAHLNTMEVASGTLVRRGQRIGTVGTANGHYLAHLHFELREFITPYIGAGYREDARGWLNPSKFVEKHRGAALGDLRPEPALE